MLWTMSEDRFASKTALMVAAYRARASRAVDPVCNDRWAESLAGAEGHALSERYDAVFPDMVLWMGILRRISPSTPNLNMPAAAKKYFLLAKGKRSNAEK